MEKIISIDNSMFFDDRDKLDNNRDIFSASQVGSTVFFNDPITNIYNLNDALKLFDENKDLTSIPVEGNYGVIGLLLKSDLKNKKASLINDLVDKKVESFIRSTDNNLNAQESIEKVIELFLKKDKDSFFDDVPVFYLNRFFGVTNFRRLSTQYNKNRRLDMQQGRNIQQFLMAKSKIQDIDCKVDIYNKMAHSLGGDFYKILKISESLSLISCFDVAGKGVSGSLSTAIISSFFTTIEVAEALEDHTPEQLVKLLNSAIFLQTPSDVFVTAMFVFIDKKSEQYIIYNCGHTQILVHKDLSMEIEEYVASAPPLGIMDKLPNMEEIKQIIPITNKTRLFIFSDGLTDIRDIEGNEFGEKGLKNFLNENMNTPLMEIGGKLEPIVNDFIGDAPQTDDITLISFQFEDITAGQKHKGLEILQNLKKNTFVESGYSSVLTISNYNSQAKKNVRFVKLFTSPIGFLLFVLKPETEVSSGYVYSKGILKKFDTSQNFVKIDLTSTFFDTNLSFRKFISLNLLQKAELLELNEEAGEKGDQYYCRVQCPEEQLGLFIDKEKYLPSKKEYLNKKGKATYFIEYKKWISLGEAHIPSEVKFTDMTIDGYTTEIIYNKIKPIKLNPSVFSNEYIRKITSEKQE